MHILTDDSHFYNKKIKSLVDNCTVFNADDVQLCIYDTYEAAKAVPFHAEQLMLCAMTQGEKVMNHHSLPTGQRFLPGQSFIIAQGEQVAIDFPTASWQQPTSCLTIEIDSKKIQQVVDKIAFEQAPDLKQVSATMQLDNSSATQALYHRLSQVFIEEPSDRSVLIDLGITELIVRLLRFNSSQMLLRHAKQDPTGSSLHAVVQFIEQNLMHPIEIEQLCKVACMGRSRLYAMFKLYLHCTPQAYLLQQRLQFAAQKIKQGLSITQACFDSGFNDPSHFSRRFKAMFGQSPKQFQQAFKQA